MAKKVTPTVKDIRDSILDELRNALMLVGEELLSEILSSYYLGSGEDTLKALQEFNTTYTIFEAEEGQLLKGFLIVKDFKIEYSQVKNFNKTLKWVKDDYKFGIVINEDPNDKIFQANQKIYFESEKQRDLEYAKIKKKLEVFNQKFK